MVFQKKKNLKFQLTFRLNICALYISTAVWDEKRLVFSKDFNIFVLKQKFIFHFGVYNESLVNIIVGV